MHSKSIHAVRAVRVLILAAGFVAGGVHAQATGDPSAERVAAEVVGASRPAEAAQRRAHHQRPKLVVGLMVDQMRYDYLYRFWDQYGDGGFRRLLDQGFSFDNAHLDYAPPFTGPGHASVYTGTTPSVHGIIANQWYLRGESRSTYVTADDGVEPVGSEGAAGRMSPQWLLASTLSDELVLHSNGRSKAVAVALKDRGSILPAGRLGDAYWFDADTARMITSSHYMDALPEWAEAFNARELAAQYLAEPWETLLPIEQYEASLADDNPYEFRFSRTFPHDIPAMAAQQGLQVLQYTPRGDTFTFDFARAAIAGEGLGQDEHTDLLAISLSSPDYIGHAYAPASVEVQDTYLRLDREIEAFLDHLDRQIGLDEVVVFLTADHGAAHNPVYVQDLGFPAEYYIADEIADRLRTFLDEQHGEGMGETLLLSFSNNQVFLDHEVMAEHGLAHEDLEASVIRYLLRDEAGVVGALGATTLDRMEFREGIRRRVQHGHHQQRSGDVVVWFRPQWLPRFRDPTGTTHASVYSYDNRLPLIFFGWDIPAGRSASHVGVADIAPTVSIIMNTPFPSSTTGRPLQDLIYDR